MKPLSREFLLNRGYCCHNSCTNCPYNMKEEALKLLEEIEENVNICCAITMEPEEVLDLIDKTIGKKFPMIDRLTDLFQEQQVLEKKVKDLELKIDAVEQYIKENDK